MTTTTVLPDLLALTEAALPELATLVSEATTKLRAKVSHEGKVSGSALERARNNFG